MKVYGLDRCIERLDSRIQRVKGNAHRVITELAYEGIEVATAEFASAQYDGTNDVEVSQRPIVVDENHVQISAEGSAVAFIEFGTGVHYTETHPKANEMGAIRGGYGIGFGQYDSWVYRGDPGTNGELAGQNFFGEDVVLTHGNPPARAMYDAAQQMRAKETEIAKKVWRND